MLVAGEEICHEYFSALGTDQSSFLPCEPGSISGKTNFRLRDEELEYSMNESCPSTLVPSWVPGYP